MAIQGVGNSGQVAGRNASAPAANQPGNPAFADLLRAASNGTRLSTHAGKRIERRELSLDADKQMRLDSAINRAAEKGSKSTVVVLDDLAVVVDVRQRTVVTAMQRDPTRERVFTNIDSVVIA